MRMLGTNNLDLLESIFEQLPDCPFVVKDKDFRYRAANSAMARLCGAARPQDLYGYKAEHFFGASLAQGFEEMDVQLFARGRPITNVLEWIVSGGKPSWVLMSRLPLQDSDGNVVGILTTSRQLKSAGGEKMYRRLAAITARLREEYDKPLRLAALAADAGISKSQLERDFLRVFSMPPNAFLQQVRMERALELLETSELSVSEVAYDCGYADHSAFTRRFQRIVGSSPRGHRLKHARARQGDGESFQTPF